MNKCYWKKKKKEASTVTVQEIKVLRYNFIDTMYN